MRPVVYDAGILIDADRNDRNRWAEHRARLESGALPVVPAAVVAQVSRTHRQVQLRRFLRGCEIVGMDEAQAHRVGALLGKSRTSDVVDACVVEVALRRRVETPDPIPSPPLYAPAFSSFTSSGTATNRSATRP